MKLFNLWNLFPSPFYASKGFLFLRKTFSFAAQVGPEEQSHALAWSQFIFSKRRQQRHLLCCPKSAGQRSLTWQALPWQHQSSAFWDVQRSFCLICFVWAARHPKILAKCLNSILPPPCEQHFWVNKGRYINKSCWRTNVVRGVGTINILFLKRLLIDWWKARGKQIYLPASVPVVGQTHVPHGPVLSKCIDLYLLNTDFFKQSQIAPSMRL